jgi:hypothetical protein
MALDATQTRQAVTGHVYAAPVGTTHPLDVITALPVAWIDLGYTKTGPSATPANTIVDVLAWQTQFPVRQVVTEQSMKYAIDLLQTNTDNLKLAFGGGATTTGTGVTVYKPPVSRSVIERSMVFEITDGAIITRWVFDRMAVSLSGAVTFDKSSPQTYPLEFSLLAPTGSNTPFEMITNDTAVAVG